MDEADVIRSVEHTRLRALVDADLEVIEQVHAADFELINPDGEVYSRRQYPGEISGGVLDYTTWDAGEIAVRMHADAAGSSAIRTDSQRMEEVRVRSVVSRKARHSVIASGCLCLSLLLACQDERNGHVQVVLRDSAGIQIVESTQPQRDSSSFWILSDEPVVVIGSPDGDGAQSLFRVADVVQLAGDLIAVVDGASQEIRVFDGAGEHVLTFGGQGEGPARFQALESLFASGDSVVAFDRGTRSVSIFSATGDHIRTSSVASPGQRMGLSLLGRLPDGSFLTHSAMLPTGESLEGVIQMPEWISRWDPTHGAVEDLVEVPGPEMVGPEGGVRTFMISRPFGRQSFYCVTGDRIVTGYTEHYDLRYHDAGGLLIRVVRKTGGAQPVTEADIRSYRSGPQTYIRGRPLADMLSDSDFPPTKPAYGGLLCDTEGNVWVRAYAPNSESGPEDWSVFDAAGHWITDLRTPASFRVTEVGHNYMLGISRDESNVEYAVKYDLVK